MGSKACRWPCGCMSEGLMYCGQNVTALSNKTENFWMWNLAEVVSSQTCRTGCAENQEGPKGSGRERCSINTVSSSRGKEIISGPFEDELAVKQKRRTMEVWGDKQEEGRRSYVNVAGDSWVSSGPSGLPPGEHECCILVLIPLLENLGQILHFTRSHFPHWSNKKLNWITLEIFS